MIRIEKILLSLTNGQNYMVNRLESDLFGDKHSQNNLISQPVDLDVNFILRCFP